MALARSPKPGDESRSNHIVSAIEDRNELCTDSDFWKTPLTIREVR